MELRSQKRTEKLINCHFPVHNINEQEVRFYGIKLTSLLSAVSLFVIAKIMGHKQMAQLDFFDYITGITIGSIAAKI